MPTTTPSSDARFALGAVAALALALATGCAHTPPEEFFQLVPESAANRAAQTREFETRDEDELLSASAAVLQDLGFQVGESVRELGFLRAAKERSAREYGQETWRWVIAFFTALASGFGGQNAIVVMPVDLHQQVNASLIVRPLNEKGDRQEVRVLFYRLVWKSDGQSGNTYIAPGQQKMEMIRDPRIYQLFFARLSKAVFLEAHKI